MKKSEYNIKLSHIVAKIFQNWQIIEIKQRKSLPVCRVILSVKTHIFLVELIDLFISLFT